MYNVYVSISMYRKKISYGSLVNAICENYVAYNKISSLDPLDNLIVFGA